MSAKQADRHGVTVKVRRRLCRSGTWTWVCHSIFDALPDTPRTWAQRRRRTANVGLLRYGPSAAAVGVSALALLGAEGLPPTSTSHVAIYGAQPREPLRRSPSSLRAPHHVDVAVRQFSSDMRTVLVDGFRVAAAEWALAQAVPELPHRHAVAVMDSLLRRRIIDAAGLARAHTLATGRRRVARTHGWWREADARAESPLESFGRVDCIEHGIAPDDLQVVVRDGSGVLLGRGDMGWRFEDGGWLLVELDGREFHEAPGALLHDRARQNSLVLDGGVRLLRFTSRDVAVPGLLAGTVRRALATWSSSVSARTG